MKPKFKKTVKGLVIIDPIERKRYPLVTDTPVTPTASNEDPIPFPIQSTTKITTSKLTLPDNPTVYVRKLDGTLNAELSLGDNISLPNNEYIIDLSGPLKVYAYINSAVHIRIGTAQTEFSFENPTNLTIGARSFHRRPAGTIRTTADPTDVMQAVSVFGSALKATDTVRSYPTLRGHPPKVELSDVLSIPDDLNRPETDVRIVVPPTLREIFVVVPLAYYLGAEVVPGATHQLVTRSGYSHSLNDKHGFETTVERIFRQIFFLDCIVQTEGESPSSLYLRETIESLLEFYISDLYDQSMTKQLKTYLEIPFELIGPQLPTWYSEVHLDPTPDNVEFLPFIANDLATVKTPDGQSEQTSVEQGFQPTRDSARTDRKGVKPNSITGMAEPKCASNSPVIKKKWKIGDSHVVSTKPLSASQNSITQSPREGPLRVEVVCNDPNMSDELVTVYSTYRESSDIPFDVSVHHDLSKNDLRNVFAKESDFLHYIGHIDTNGFRCSDGVIDAADLEAVGTKTFFLNACQSYEQGLKLIKAGSIGGIVTLTEIQNQIAVNAGSTIAQLLDSGMPLYGAVKLLQQTTNDTHQYHLIGNGEIVMSHMEIGAPLSIKIVRDGSAFEITISSYVNSRYKPGSIYTPYISVSDSYYLTTEEITFDHVPKAELIDFLNKEKFPALLEGDLRWSTEIKTSEL